MKNYISSDLDLATFRYTFIAPLLSGFFGNGITQEEYYKKTAGVYQFNGKNVKISAFTIKRWYLSYKKHGIKGLENKKRTEKRSHRKVDDRIIEIVRSYLQENPRITGRQIYSTLIKENIIGLNKFSYPTLARLIRTLKLEEKYVKKEMLRFTHIDANDCWQADTSHAVYINVNGKNKKTYMMSIIDDASRYVVGSRIVLADTAMNFLIVLMEAIRVNGVPKMLFLDNGSAYRNKFLEAVCAKIGINLVHAKPFCCSSKGKVERLFKTVKSQWMNRISTTNITLEQLSASFDSYIKTHYNKTNHSSIKEQPQKRYTRDISKFKYISDEELWDAFKFSEKRRIKNDSTFVLNNKVYEAPAYLAKKTIEIRYTLDYKEVSVVFGNKEQKVEEVVPEENVNYKRKENIRLT